MSDVTPPAPDSEHDPGDSDEEAEEEAEQSPPGTGLGANDDPLK